MTTIIVNDINHVSVDGVQAGSVTDVLMNYSGVEGIRGLLLAALSDWHSNNLKCHSDYCKSISDKHTKDLNDLADQNQKSTEELQAKYHEDIQGLMAHQEKEIQDLKDKNQKDIDDIKAKHEKDTDEAYEKNKKQFQETISKHISEYNKIVEENQDFRSQIVTLQAQIDALGGTELGQRLAREAEIRKATELFEKAKANLDTLTSKSENTDGTKT